MKNTLSKVLIVIISLMVLVSIAFPLLSEKAIEGSILVMYIFEVIVIIALIIVLVFERKKEIKEEEKNDISNY